MLWKYFKGNGTSCLQPVFKWFRVKISSIIAYQLPALNPSMFFYLLNIKCILPRYQPRAFPSKVLCLCYSHSLEYFFDFTWLAPPVLK